MKIIIISISLFLATGGIMYSSNYKDNIVCTKYAKALITSLTQDEYLQAFEVPPNCYVLADLRKIGEYFRINLSLIDGESPTNMTYLINDPFLGKSTVNNYPVYFFGENFSFMIDSLSPIAEGLECSFQKFNFKLRDEDDSFNFQYTIWLSKELNFIKDISTRVYVLKDVSLLENITKQYLEKDTSKIITSDSSVEVYGGCHNAPLYANGSSLYYLIEKMKKERLVGFEKSMRAFVGFCVSKEGVVNNFRISNSSGCAKFDSIALNIVKELPLDYIPGDMFGEKVDCQSAIKILYCP